MCKYADRVHVCARLSVYESLLANVTLVHRYSEISPLTHTTTYVPANMCANGRIVLNESHVAKLRDKKKNACGKKKKRMLLLLVLPEERRSAPLRSSQSQAEPENAMLLLSIGHTKTTHQSKLVDIVHGERCCECPRGDNNWFERFEFGGYSLPKRAIMKSCIHIIFMSGTAAQSPFSISIFRHSEMMPHSILITGHPVWSAKIELHSKFPSLTSQRNISDSENGDITIGWMLKWKTSVLTICHAVGIYVFTYFAFSMWYLSLLLYIFPCTGIPHFHFRFGPVNSAQHHSWWRSLCNRNGE